MSFIFFLNKLCLPSPVKKITKIFSRRLTVSPMVRRGNILRSAASLLAAIGKYVDKIF